MAKRAIKKAVRLARREAAKDAAEFVAEFPGESLTGDWDHVGFELTEAARLARRADDGFNGRTYARIFGEYSAHLDSEIDRLSTVA